MQGIVTLDGERTGHGHELWIAAQEIVVAPGESVDLHLAFASRSVRVRVLDHDGKPAVARPVYAVARIPERLGGWIVSDTVHTDDDGVAVLERAPTVPFDVAVFATGSYVPNVLRDGDDRLPFIRTGPILPDQRTITVRLDR